MIDSKSHILDLDLISVSQVESILDDADEMTKILNSDFKKTEALKGKTIITLFFEPSTRTRSSFEQAGKILGADVINIVNSSSSSKKGESLYNTALTIQSIKSDVIVLRHPHSGAPYFLSNLLKESTIINAGDGMHAHPTQALLDMYVMKKHLGNLKNKRIVFIGDISHSRVVRSNILGLSKFGAKIVLCGPQTLIPPDLLSNKNLPENHPFKNIYYEPKLNDAINQADVIMPLRLQRERQDSGLLPSLREYSTYFGISLKKLQHAKPNTIIMHPGPVNEGVEIDHNVVHGQNSVIQEQVFSGVAIRMAILKSVTQNKASKIE